MGKPRRAWNQALAHPAAPSRYPTAKASKKYRVGPTERIISVNSIMPRQNGMTVSMSVGIHANAVAPTIYSCQITSMATRLVASANHLDILRLFMFEYTMLTRKPNATPCMTLISWR